MESDSVLIDDLIPDNGNSNTRPVVKKEQIQQTEYFNNGLYVLLGILVLWVFFVSIGGPCRLFRMYGSSFCMDYEGQNMTMSGHVFIAMFTIIVYFFAFFASTYIK